MVHGPRACQLLAAPDFRRDDDHFQDTYQRQSCLLRILDLRRRSEVLPRFSQRLHRPTDLSYLRLTFHDPPSFDSIASTCARPAPRAPAINIRNPLSTSVRAYARSASAVKRPKLLPPARTGTETKL